MNDRFRFRVWGISQKKFENKKTVEDARIGFLPKVSSNYIVEQCTGLKDRNGRLIYEGDIVESTIATRNNKPARDVIKYNNEFAGFEPMCCYDCDCGIYNPADELVIVGNIHENSELLEK